MTRPYRITVQLTVVVMMRRRMMKTMKILVMARQLNRLPLTTAIVIVVVVVVAVTVKIQMMMIIVVIATLLQDLPPGPRHQRRPQRHRPRLHRKKTLLHHLNRQHNRRTIHQMQKMMLQQLSKIHL